MKLRQNNLFSLSSANNDPMGAKERKAIDLTAELAKLHRRLPTFLSLYFEPASSSRSLAPFMIAARA